MEPIQDPGMLDTLLRYVSPLLVIIGSLAIFIYRSKVKEIEKDIKDEVAERKASLKELGGSLKKEIESIANLFKDALKEERTFRTETMLRLEDHVDAILKRMEENSVTFSKIGQKLDSHIDNQEKICKLNHKK